MTTVSKTDETSSRRRLVIVILLLILLAAFALRAFHIDWADGQLPHPDERSTVAFYAPSIHWPPASVSPFDKRQSPLNPLWEVNRQERRSYTYGHFPLYLLVLTANGVSKLAPLAEKLGVYPDLVETLRMANGVPGFALVGRTIMAIADTFTVLLVFLLADRIYGRRKGRRWVGLLAAAFSAFTVLQIQLSHFFAVDPISTTFTVLALYGALRMSEDRSMGWSIVTGVGAGLAISSKFSALPILAAPVVAGLLMGWHARRANTPTAGPSLARIAGLVVVALAVTLVVFAVTSPFSILDWANFKQAVLIEQGAMVRGEADFPFTRQYRGTLPYIYFVEQNLRWGIGWPLGILAFGSLVWALAKLLFGKARDGEIILLSWIVPYFGLTGLFLAKFMRYMVPVVPLLMVLAAGLVAALWYGELWPRRTKRVLPPDEPPADPSVDIAEQPAPIPTAGQPDQQEMLQASDEPELLLFTATVAQPDLETAAPPAVQPEKWSTSQDESGLAPATLPPATLPPATPPPATRWLAVVVAIAALLGAIFWSLAYVNGVYNTSHPWIKASNWIYANIPDGSTIGWEQWDDSLPYDLPDPNSSRGRYQFTDWGPFEEDTPEKYERLKEFLRRSDAIALSSNRIYGAVDNLPERYPLTNRYYQLLFDGKLGYELALEQANHPNLLGIDINDEKADESFTLYDHARVLVFRKVRDLSDAEFDSLLGGSWQGAKPWDVGKPPLIQRLWSVFEPAGGNASAPRPEPRPGEGKSLLLDQPLDEQPVVQDFRWNNLASRSTPLAVVVWWLAISIIGWFTWPIGFTLFRNLRDRGYLLSRSLGWLLLGYLVWIAASLRIAENRLTTIWVALALIAALSFLLWRRQRPAMADFWRAQKRFVVLGEGLFAAAFLLFVAFRIANPDIWQPWNGGEKFMEFAFLNAILRSPTFPPIDPYFAGGTINYYYFGHYLVALLVKITGIWSSVAFNLAVSTVFALTIANTFSLGANLAAGLGDRAKVRARAEAGRSIPASVPAPADEADESSSLAETAFQQQEPSELQEILPETGFQAVDAVAVGDAVAHVHPETPETDVADLRHEHDVPAVAHTPKPAFSPLPRLAVLSGLLAAFFVAMLGNVDGGGQVVRKLSELSAGGFQSNLPGVQTAVRAAGGLAKVLGGANLPSYNYWDPSRVIPNTINEFPYWSFLFADLHPHMIGIGFTVLFLALAYNLLAGTDSTPQRTRQSDGPGRRIIYIVRVLTGDGLYVVMALALGALAVINTWDLPTYFGLAMLVWLIREWRTGQMAASWRRALVRTVIFALGLAAAAILLYLPFFAHYEALASSGIGINKVADDLGKWLNMWGFLGFLAASFVLVELRRRGQAETQEDGPSSASPRDPAFLRWLRVALNRITDLARWVEVTPRLSTRALAAIGLAFGLTALLWLTGWQVPAVLLLPLLGAFALLWRRRASSESLFVGVLLFTAFLVLMGVEFVYLKDHLQGGEWRRMNTLFKFYIQVWVMLGLGAAVALPATWRFVQGRWKPVWRVLWTGTFIYLLVLSLVFLVAGTRARLDDRFPPENGRPPVGTLDGMAYMSAGTYTWHPDPALSASTRIELRYDYDALRWLLDNVKGTPVVAEALNGYYREGGLRVASFTGFPTLLGFHEEGEQRYGWQTGQRRGLAEEFWRTTDPARASELIDELGIDIIYVGQLETIVTPPESLAKFQAMAKSGDLRVLYSNDKVIIYQVADAAVEAPAGGG